LLASKCAQKNLDVLERRALLQVRAIRRGWLKPRGDPDEEKKAPPVYMLWDDDGAADTARTGAGLTYIPAPKPDLPGHEESYNPPHEYLPTEVERRDMEAMEEEDKPALIPRTFECLRKVPQYERVIHERFERCLDLYLCPRVRSKRINYKPEDLIPKELPQPGDLRPFPNTLCVMYSGHKNKVCCPSCPRH
jgi:ribosome biogenesis protein ERB1